MDATPDPAAQAEALFRQGFSCAPSVLVPFSEPLGLSRDLALRLATPFGSGIAGRAETCGAVTGALLVIGLAHGRTRPEDVAARDRTYELSRAFCRRFEDHHRTLSCKELLGIDISVPCGLRQAKERRVFEEICPALVRDAARIVRDVLAEASAAAGPAGGAR